LPGADPLIGVLPGGSLTVACIEEEAEEAGFASSPAMASKGTAGSLPNSSRAAVAA
jgi:hypothetical protein